MRRTTLLATATGAIALAFVFTTLPATAAATRATRVVESTSDLRPSERVVGAREASAPDIVGVLAVTPGSYQDGSPVTITVSGSVSVTSERAFECFELSMGAFGRGERAIASKYLSPPFSISPGVAQTLSVSDELKVDEARLGELFGELTVYVWAECWYTDPEDKDPWFYLNLAEHTITPSGLQLRLDKDWIFPDISFIGERPKWHKRAAKLEFHSPGPKPTLTVLRNGKPVWTFKAPSSSGSASLPMSVVAPRATYTVRISAGQESQVSVPLPVFHGSSPLLGAYFSYTPVITWPKCSTIRWHYDASKAPKSAGTFIAELEKVMRYFTRVTGIQFERTEKKGAANLLIDWAKELLYGASGVGGFEAYGGVAESGFVTLDSTDEWAQTPGMKSPGRGPLIFHEMGHALGLGHVRTADSLMFPTHTLEESPNRPSKLEVAFLKEMYKPETCK